MNFCGIQVSTAEALAIAGVATTVASEVIAASPLRDNSIVQLGLSLVRRFLPSTAHTPLASEVTPTPAPTPAPSASSPESPSPAPKRRGRPPGSTSARSAPKKASK